ncbi:MULTISPECIES: LysR family transcriptional regulator [Pandoraea]|uniref:LysR family transcriptional regulator n=1 Tax=Pandoraea capi TaxID=2508286 RepID=A0ABY6VUH3_9BURK|nr:MULTISPECIES: LysR family transcriptional regulator [Pandoraea]MCI3205045.1 LysR family transcriptional regulator [Pandoraea sp. LA3]MDN4583073.1 LysR family transcriptional regulator [Pandoraea capi]VVD64398.1 LysR family transcriptional regulator [Pandoraea capi]
MDNLAEITAFVRAAETLSFVAAGRATGVSASAVGKQIARLETTLGVRLFQRSTRRVNLTEAGQMYYERCRRVLDELADARAMLSQVSQTPRGKLRVGLPVTAYRFLMPLLPAFAQQYPDIELDLDFDDRIVDLIDNGLDVVIRSGDLPDSTLMSRRAGPFRFVLCASPGYLATHGTPQTPQALEAHRCIRFRFPTSGKLQPWAFVADVAHEPKLSTSLTCNNMEALLSATTHGLGIAYMPDFLARDALADGHLQTFLGDYLVNPGQFWMLWPSSRHLSPKLRVFVDFMCNRML